MAVRALGECQLLFKIAPRVALAAAHLQRASPARDISFSNGRTASRDMLTFFQLAVVWQDSQVPLNAPLCGSVWQSVQVSNLIPVYLTVFSGPGGEVAFFAGYLRVHAGQRIFCFRMVELLGLLPVRERCGSVRSPAPSWPFADRHGTWRNPGRGPERFGQVCFLVSVPGPPGPCALEYGISRRQPLRAFPPADSQPVCDRTV